MIGDRLPYAGHLDEVTLRTRDGLLMQVLHMRGLPFETKPDDELNYRKTLRETLLRGAASSRLAIYHHVIRRRVSPRFTGSFNDPFCEHLDRTWRARLSERRLYANDLFLTLVRRPLQGEAGVLEGLFRRPANDQVIERELRALHATRETFAAGLAPYGARALTTYDLVGGVGSRPAEFLSMLVNAETRPIQAPTGDLGHALAIRRLNFGLDVMEFAGAGGAPPIFGAMISLKDYPARSAPGMLDGVLRLPCELTLTESFAFVDRQASLDRMSLSLRRLRAADSDALSLRQELSMARDEVGAGRAAYGEHHLTLLVKAASLDELDAAVAETQSALAEAGAIAVLEDVNLEPAFWAQFPGNFKYIARRAMVSAANFASLASLHGHPLGQSEGLHWGDPVTVLETTAFGPYNFNFHVGDLGNFTVIGPSGTGKTVLLTFLVAQAEKFKARVVFFDKDRGAEIFIRAAAGRYDLLAPGEPSGLNPLQLRDTPENRAFLIDWLEQLLAHGGSTLDAEERTVLADAVDASYAQAVGHRRLRHLRELLRGVRRPSAGDLAARLAAWCDDGEHAWLFDNLQDRLDLEVDRLGFDMTRLLDHPVVRTPAMMYLFHRVEQRLDGQAVIIIIDEGWKALDDPVFVRRIRDWMKTIRKRNGVVGFCTQSAGDALESRIASAIIEQAATQIFFPNARARAADYIEGFGLTEHEFDLVRTLPDTARCFLVKQAGHSVVARLDLAGMGDFLQVLAGNERSVRRLDSLRASLGDDPAAWLEPFMTNTTSQ
ncbi:MAG TPA: VirB4 family type IV secretion/conjugal transfer ATPase [Caulobacteraceae bacterium]